jgi:hypothetical protein
MLMGQKDKEIINHVQQYGFITIGQCYLIWFNDRKYGYDIARKHLNKIVQEGYLKNYKPVSNIYAEKVYYSDSKYATPTKSMLISMDVYAELKRLGADIIYFKREERWLEDKYRSDAYTVFNLNRYIFSCCIEVIDSTKLTYLNHKKTFISKYENIYSSDEPLKKMIEITELKRNFDFPTLLVVSEIGQYDLDIEGINIVYLDYSLQKLSQVFINK